MSASGVSNELARQHRPSTLSPCLRAPLSRPGHLYTGISSIGISEKKAAGVTDSTPASVTTATTKSRTILKVVSCSWPWQAGGRARTLR